MTEQIPTEDRHNLTEDFLLARLVIMLAGRSAEKLRYGVSSTGAEDDLKQATRLAYKMVGQWGMGQRLGAAGYSVAEEHPFLGRDIAVPREFGEDTARIMDEEVRTLLAAAETDAENLLQKHSGHLESLLGALLEFETLDHAHIEKLLAEAV